jgi:proline dehydrogenase
MSGMLHARLRDARYALPGLVERIVPGETARDAAAHCARLGRGGIATTAGYFGAVDAICETVTRANEELAAALVHEGCDTLLALKAPALEFDSGRVRAIAATGVPVIFDALAEPHAARTLALAEEFGAGLALPARWRRSSDDAVRLRDGPCRIRVVKGEWADPAGDFTDIAACFLGLAASLAGRRATVAVATHDPALAEAALRLLLDEGTPCELEQLRGLPRCRTMAVARRLGVAVRLYRPFGPGWWSYAVDKALGRPYLPVWALKDWLRM